MRELQLKEIAAVSGGAVDISQALKDIYEFLKGPNNPLSGESVSGVVAGIFKGLLTKVVHDVIAPWVKK